MIENKQTESTVKRWLRISVLSLSVLGPVVNSVVARLGDRPGQGRKHEKNVTHKSSTVKKALFGKDAATGKQTGKPSLSDAFLELKDRPYSQELLKRGEALVEELEELVERGTKLSHSLVERGSDVTRDLAERGSKASQELVERSSKASQELVKRSEEAGKELHKRGRKLNKELNKRSRKLTKELSKRGENITGELSKRSRQATAQLTERSGAFWIVFGFSVGLVVASVTAYVFIRQRILQQREEQEPSFPVSQNGYLNTVQASTMQGTVRSVSQPDSLNPRPQIPAKSTPAAILAEHEPEVPTERSAPPDATLVGVVSTRRYYPVATPLTRLAASNKKNGKIDVIYFASEEEAKAQGYTPAS